MSNPSVVILTEPARCGLADVDTLVQAVLQVQQLKHAGVAAAEAFCDHPAAALKFIEAYTKAYPELQLRSGDLPPPEALFSIVADGRVRPLQAPAPDSAKIGEAGQLYPLYILSLGAPDALMRALQRNNFAQRDIQVVEIAPVESADAAAVSVAEAVAHEPTLHASWRPEAAAEAERGDDGLVASEELAPSDPVKLASVEINLDHIKVDQKDDDKNHVASDVGFDQPAIALPAPVTGTSGDANGGPLGAGSGATFGGAAPAASASPTDLLGTVAPAPAAAAPTSTAPLPSAPAAAPPGGEDVGSGAPSDGAIASPTEPSGDLAPADDAAAAADGAGTASPEGTAEPTPEDAAADGAGTASPEGTAEPTPEDAAAPSASAGESGGEPAGAPASESESTACAKEGGAGAGHGFDASGGDVLYPPNGSFGAGADVAYPMAASGPAAPVFEVLFGGSGDCDVVDIEALCCALPAPAPEALDLDLVRAPGSGQAGAAEMGGPSPQTDAGASPYPDAPPEGEDDPCHDRLPAAHDLDA
jgi:hypothetical protein